MWYLIGYGIIALSIFFLPMIMGETKFMEDDGLIDIVLVAVFWAPILCFGVFAGLFVGISLGIEKGYAKATKYMHNHWEQRKQNKLKAIDNTAIDTSHNQTEDYRRTHCQGCGKIV